MRTRKKWRGGSQNSSGSEKTTRVRLPANKRKKPGADGDRRWYLQTEFASGQRDLHLKKKSLKIKNRLWGLLSTAAQGITHVHREIFAAAGSHTFVENALFSAFLVTFVVERPRARNAVIEAALGENMTFRGGSAHIRRLDVPTCGVLVPGTARVNTAHISVSLGFMDLASAERQSSGVVLRRFHS